MPVVAWCKDNDPEYLKNELQKIFDQKGWLLIYTPPGKPEWQPMETVCAKRI